MSLPNPVEIEIDGATYSIYWNELVHGTSFFIPCLDPDSARVSLRKTAPSNRRDLYIIGTVENGIRGLRVWRKASKKQLVL